MLLIKIREMLNAETPLLRNYLVASLEYLKLFYLFVAAIAEVYKNEGNDEYNQNNFNSAIHFYTEGIKVNCKDEELNAKLYSNRATAHFNLGKKLFYISFYYMAQLLSPGDYSICGPHPIVWTKF